jgi:hypothetical protein
MKSGKVWFIGDTEWAGIVTHRAEIHVWLTYGLRMADVWLT